MSKGIEFVVITLLGLIFGTAVGCELLILDVKHALQHQCEKPR